MPVEVVCSEPAPLLPASSSSSDAFAGPLLSARRRHRCCRCPEPAPLLPASSSSSDAFAGPLLSARRRHRCCRCPESAPLLLTSLVRRPGCRTSGDLFTFGTHLVVRVLSSLAPSHPACSIRLHRLPAFLFTRRPSPALAPLLPALHAYDHLRRRHPLVTFAFFACLANALWTLSRCLIFRRTLRNLRSCCINDHQYSIVT
jgi:hypothetical protein